MNTRPLVYLGETHAESRGARRTRTRTGTLSNMQQNTCHHVRMHTCAHQDVRADGVHALRWCNANPADAFRCGGAVELVDASEMLPDLHRRPGWTRWKVMDEDLREWATYAETQDKAVPAPRRRLFAPSMWPPAAQPTESRLTSGAGHAEGKKRKKRARKVRPALTRTHACAHAHNHTNRHAT